MRREASETSINRPELHILTDYKNLNLLLVVTGSIAAIKTRGLIQALSANRFHIRAVLTQSAKDYGFVSIEDIEKLTGNPTLKTDDFSAASGQAQGLLNDADIILVSPASAGFIAQIAHETTTIGEALHQSRARKIIAPAMNKYMWQHPAVQRNIHALMERGWLIAGPVEGPLACGEFGYGRMLETDHIAANMLEAVEDNANKNELATLHQRALMPHANLPKLENTNHAINNILLLIHSAEDMPLIEQTIATLIKRGKSITCALAEEARSDEALQRLYELTGNTVYTKHYQDDPEGMEHINLSRKNDVLLAIGTTHRYAEEMAEGGSSSFVSDVYLATDKPVIMVPSASKTNAPDKRQLEQIKRDGATITSADSAIDILEK